jgi:acetyl-CoA synthetase
MTASGIDWTAPTYEEILRRHRWVIPERFNIAEAACDRYARGQATLALTTVHDGSVHRYTFDDLADHSDRLASVFAGLGVERGDRVAVFLPQRVENPLSHLAAFKLGAVSVPLSPLFRAQALAYRLRHSGAKILITDPEHLEHAREALTDLDVRVLSCEATTGAFAPSAEPFWTLLRDAPRRRAVDTSAHDPAMLIYTSGTSGMPKGALHAHRFIPGRLSGFELVHRLEAGPLPDRPFYTPADWAWVGGLVDCVLTPWMFGRPVLGVVRSRFEPEEFVRTLVEHRVRSLFLAPTALHRLRGAVSPDAVRAADIFAVHTAGEPLSPAAYAWASSAFGDGNVFELYGMTEMGATIGHSPFFEVRPGSMGRPYPGHDVELLSSEGEVVRGGGRGQIAVRRGDPGMFLGYLGDPEATRDRFSADGEWFLTGDIAERSEDGWLRYVGRDDDMFNTSGYRVGPTEIEAALASHPDVEHAAVVGEPDEERGAIVKAFVVLRSGATPSPALADEIRIHVKERLATYEYPRRIVFARELPMTSSGKVRRQELRASDADARFGLGSPAARG